MNSAAPALQLSARMTSLQERPPVVSSTRQSRWLGEPANEVIGSLADLLRCRLTMSESGARMARRATRKERHQYEAPV
jgi:hypothetical protein